MSSSLILRSSLSKSILKRSIFRSSIQVRQATSDRFAYVPGGPIYKGTVNDPTTFPPPSKTHGSYHWAFERLLSAALVPMTVTAFATSGTNYPLFDGILGLSLIIHSHIGFPVFGPIIRWTLRAATVGTMVGVYQFNTNDIGLTELIAKVWTA
ncbi:SDHD, membrane anchor subunit of succinate dehydrogenase [Lentinula aff. detonsa]|nr:SDHD, membrane anchor subunit of succinate dehydrogenase [Lentinula aff. detonsa]